MLCFFVLFIGCLIKQDYFSNLLASLLLENKLIVHEFIHGCNAGYLIASGMQ
ncbi:hypothetical protein [Clostridium estertheticum]|uniref:hypothetical protein n=1 Tax=Clostridium estertheticum TaxID=238834 RepID=UPI001CF5B43D|nr:hypothetical protein [Clostridium estertheticum]MCB2357048.1 hypothetical protein [Clostridium estertheticum]WAG40369.1 hypothetical protein LL065_19185 [Clostridium estertheticum]